MLACLKLHSPCIESSLCRPYLSLGTVLIARLAELADEMWSTNILNVFSLKVD